VRFMSQVRAGPDKATWKYVAITAVFPPTTVMTVTYTCRNPDGFDVPSYFFGKCGQNLGGHDATRRWSARAAQPTPAKGTPVWDRVPIGVCGATEAKS
jgi:hypothetical protein